MISDWLSWHRSSRAATRSEITSWPGVAASAGSSPPCRFGAAAGHGERPAQGAQRCEEGIGGVSNDHPCAQGGQLVEPILPGGWGISRISDSALTLLPQPDSPTSPSASPSFSENDTPLTALTTPSWVKNWVRRSRTSNNGRLLCSACILARLPCGYSCPECTRTLPPAQD